MTAEAKIAFLEAPLNPEFPLGNWMEKQQKVFFYTNLAYEDADNGKSGLNQASFFNAKSGSFQHFFARLFHAQTLSTMRLGNGASQSVCCIWRRIAG